jgi:two-component system, NarL family, invasion response regulator UvrY
MMSVNKVLLIDDHPLVRAGCRRMLRVIRATVLEATTGAAALQINREEQPNIIFLDISLPDINGTDMLDRLRAENVGARVIVLTMYEDLALAHRLLRRGAAGYITKSDSPACMLLAIERVCRGDSFVSPYLTSRAESGTVADGGVAELSLRDRHIIDLLGDGKSLSEISYELGQSYKTIANATNMMRGKLGLRTNAALIKLAVERRLAQSPDACTTPAAQKSQ